jgi:hypothetical protein
MYETQWIENYYKAREQKRQVMKTLTVSTALSYPMTVATLFEIADSNINLAHALATV